MIWLKRKLRNWLNNEVEKQARPIVSVSNECINNHGINFTLHRGNGGHALELREYDSKSDRNHTVLHIIPSDRDLGQAIAHIITFESLKK
jgi:hypothetical protein